MNQCPSLDSRPGETERSLCGLWNDRQLRQTPQKCLLYIPNDFSICSHFIVPGITLHFSPFYFSFVLFLPFNLILVSLLSFVAAMIHLFML